MTYLKTQLFNLNAPLYMHSTNSTTCGAAHAGYVARVCHGSWLTRAGISAGRVRRREGARHLW